jgi:CheY-like chemotaxis protein
MDDMRREMRLKPRILIFEDNDTIRSTLENLLVNQGYEVHCFPNPGMCPQYMFSNHNCLLDDSCSDIIISDVNMPVETGIEFITNRLNLGCKVKFRALMSADWTETDLRNAKRFGCKVFHKPFELGELLNWLKDCQNQLDDDRILAEVLAKKDK